jgi:hypothetical protein
MGNKYAPVAVENVQILFQPPPWPYEQIGIVTSLGAQVASDATVYRELQNQAAQLGADAVLIISAGDKPLPGGGYFAPYGRSASGFAMSGGSGFRLPGDRTEANFFARTLTQFWLARFESRQCSAPDLIKEPSPKPFKLLLSASALPSSFTRLLLNLQLLLLVAGDLSMLRVGPWINSGLYFLVFPFWL